MSHVLGVLLYFGQTNRIKRSVKSNLIPLLIVVCRVALT